MPKEIFLWLKNTTRGKINSSNMSLIKFRQNLTDFNETANESFYDYEDMDYATLRHSLPITIVYCIAYALVFVIGLVGNVLVMMVVLRTRIMKTTVFYFLFNLALADLLVIIFCVPATLIGNVYTGESILI